MTTTHTSITLATLVAGGLLVGATADRAQAQGYYYPAPVYVAPAPVVVAPAPVVCAPRPVYYPRPVYCPPRYHRSVSAYFSYGRGHHSRHVYHGRRHHGHRRGLSFGFSYRH
jgi:hypothetical protein